MELSANAIVYFLSVCCAILYFESFEAVRRGVRIYVLVSEPTFVIDIEYNWRLVRFNNVYQCCFDAGSSR